MFSPLNIKWSCRVQRPRRFERQKYSWNMEEVQLDCNEVGEWKHLHLHLHLQATYFVSFSWRQGPPQASTSPHLKTSWLVPMKLIYSAQPAKISEELTADARMDVTYWNSDTNNGKDVDVLFFSYTFVCHTGNYTFCVHAFICYFIMSFYFWQFSN